MGLFLSIRHLTVLLTARSIFVLVMVMVMLLFFLVVSSRATNRPCCSQISGYQLGFGYPGGILSWASCMLIGCGLLRNRRVRGNTGV